MILYELKRRSWSTWFKLRAIERRAWAWECDQLAQEATDWTKYSAYRERV